MVGAYLYIAEISSHVNLFKIGVSGDPKRRMEELRRQYGLNCKLIRKDRFMYALGFESDAISQLGRYKYLSPVGRSKRPSREVFKADYSSISSIFDGFSDYTISEEISHHELLAIKFARIAEEH